MAQLTPESLRPLFDSTAEEAKTRLKQYLENFRILDIDDGDIDVDMAQKAIQAELGSTSFQKIIADISLLKQVQLNSIRDTKIRILGGAHPDDGSPSIEEVRFDWSVEHSSRQSLKLPALKISTPGTYRLSLVLQNSSGNGHLPHKAFLAASFDTDSDERRFTAESNFAWTRGDKNRELQNDEKRTEEGKPPLLSFSLEYPGEAAGASIALLEFDLHEPGLPGFFQLYDNPLPQLNGLSSTPSPASFKTFTNEWAANLDFNLDGAPFTLPFLKNNKDGQASGIQQFIDIVDVGSPESLLSQSEIKIPIDFQIGFGKLAFDTGIDMFFDWNSFAFRVEHDGGIDLLTDTKEFNAFPEFLGLNWRFIGADTDKPSKFHLFTLVTKNYNYQLQMAEGAQVIIEYTKLSEDPIAFGISDFSISGKGISLTAEVLNQPTKLNGIDTKFTFEGTSITIIENKIQDFTLMGSGPLPPALVGDAMVDISLQFSTDEGGNLDLVAGGARLQKNQLLQAKNTRFNFQVDALGLKFVNENGFHLFFIMTGAAMFTPTKGDPADGPLTPLAQVKIAFVDCPLTGDASVLAKHVKFLVELPEPITFSFLGCFAMEIRGLGFIPAARQFDGDPAMQISGQVMFSTGGYDTKSARADFHGLYIGVPARGSFIPRISLEGLALEIKFGEAFRLAGNISFVDTAERSGFEGNGLIEIKGLPTVAASFAFMRVRRDADGNWLRAWFIYLEVGQISLQIPVVNLFIREIGLGFGYRYTLTSIKAADEAKDLAEMVKTLRELSKTQGNLTSLDAWATDIEAPGEDLRWTIVFKAVISQTSASAAIKYNQFAERHLACTFLFDVVVAFRSDLTFLMAARLWLNTNYNDYYENVDEIRNYPLMSGFLHLDPVNKRLLASAATNPDGRLGQHPPFPPFMEMALQNSQFSMTLLIEPGLFHYEMGWPNLLRWNRGFGPLVLEERGGFVFRISTKELVVGISYISRGKLELKAGIDAGIVGVELTALAEIAFGARFIGASSFDDPLNSMALYGVIGLEARVQFSVRFWIDLGLFDISLKFSFHIGFSASLEIALLGTSPGIRGTGIVSVGAMGRSVRVKVRVAAGESAVDGARARTEKYLDIGIERADTSEGAPSFFSVTGPRLRGLGQPLSMPGYNVFVIPAEEEGQSTFFLLYPQGEREDGPETGFLPVPPKDIEENGEMVPDTAAIASDFQIEFPAGSLDGYEIRQLRADGAEVLDSLQKSWKANWRETILEGDGPDEKASLSTLAGMAFIKDSSGNYFDPEPLAITETLADARVHNPTEEAFEEAVRGALEQFQGSPYFKHDPGNEYDRGLSEALSTGTSIYSEDGKVDGADGEVMKRQEQADQSRGFILQNMIEDVREYARRRRNGESEEALRQSGLTERSVAFQMGLAFEVKKTGNDKPLLPGWLEEITEDETELPKISQRIGKEATQANAEPVSVRPFNIRETRFSENPPQFERVIHYTDANTIAITWSLRWNEAPAAGCTPCQADPEHHLQYYTVIRRTLDNSEPDLQYQVKSGAVLHKPSEGILKALQPRFQVVDHFNQESLEEQAALPPTGRTYLYTITPIDFAGNAGRPLSVVATRYPNQPPQIPVESQLLAAYSFKNAAAVEAIPEEGPFSAATLLPGHDSLNSLHIELSWKDPLPPREGPQIPIGKYFLVFRREEALPVGSYGVDTGIQGSRSQQLPTGSARPLPTDIKVSLKAEGRPTARRATEAELPDGSTTPLFDELLRKGVIPRDGQWRPDAWSVFIQTVSVNGVPSALVPVQLLLRFESDEGTNKEERRPAQLEFLPVPLLFPLLPPEDQAAVTGNAHFPMFGQADDGTFDFSFGTALTNLEHRQHPAGIRAIRFRWNQGPSAMPDYPLRLNAGFDILQLDIDAHTTSTFNDREELAKAIKEIQEVRMAPASNMLLIPGDTLTTSQWEAWYPSAMERLDGQRPEGSELPFSPWFSWRESILKWPAWPGITDSETPDRGPGLHPFFEDILEQIEGDGTQFIVSRQIPPPVQPETELDFLKNTPPKNDPYGWGILQRLGLSTAFSIRRVADGELAVAGELLEVVKSAIDEISKKPENADFPAHLFIELLFQQGRSVELEEKATEAGRLLGILQLSLRPLPQTTHFYHSLSVSAPPNASVNLVFPLTVGNRITVIDRARPSLGESYLETEEVAGEDVKLSLRMPLTGTNELLLRSKAVNIAFSFEYPLKGEGYTAGPITGLSHVRIADNPARLIVQPAFYAQPDAALDSSLQTLEAELAEEDHYILDFRSSGMQAFRPYDERSTYFTQPPSLLEDMLDPTNVPVRAQWHRFARLATSGNSNDPAAPKIEIPTEEAKLKDFLPAFLEWSQRFMDHSPPMKQSGPGPWVATAYPRAGTPAYATPDASGRIQYDHLLEDRWAHNYRYYIRPFGRYGELWRSLMQSPVLFPGQGLPELEATPAPEADAERGALDVVLDRSQAVAAPVVLRSGRLDEPSRPGSPAVPGTLWEVIVAQHPEQALMEHNQALYRQLSFRQIAFSLLRRFSQPGMRDDLKILFGSFDFDAVEEISDSYPEIPHALPAQAEQLNLQVLDANEKLSLRIPERIGRFSQNALVLQWQALPFFYEQKLLLIAQTASTVSRINSVRQQDFHYQSPEPEAILQAVDKEGARQPQLLIPLKRLWDALSPDAQAQWAAEAPKPYTATNIRYSALPDLETVYQLVELFDGNIEVQTEYAFTKNEASRAYEQRQIAKRFIPDTLNLMDARAADNPLDAFVLDIGFNLPLDIPVLRPYDKGDILDPTSSRVEYLADDKLLRIQGILYPADVDNILWNSVTELREIRIYLDTVDENDPAARASFLEEWYSTRLITTKPNLGTLPDALQDKLEILEVRIMPKPEDLDAVLQPQAAAGLDTTTEKLVIHSSELSWKGILTASQEAALQDFIGDTSVLLLQEARECAGRLLDELTTEKAWEAPYQPLKDPFPNKPEPEKLSIIIAASTAANTQARWTLKWEDDFISSEEEDTLRSLAEDEALSDSEKALISGQINQLISQINQQHEVETAPGTTVGFDINDPGEGLDNLSIQEITVILNIKKYKLKWVGDFTPADATALRKLDGNVAFKNGIETLIAQIEQRHEASFNMSWPVQDLAKLGDTISEDLSKVSILSNKVRWARSQEESALIGKLRNALNATDPFLIAMENIQAQVEAARVTKTVLKTKLLRATQFLTEKERDSLLAIANAEGQAAIAHLYEDLYDRDALEEAMKNFISVEYLSSEADLDALGASHGFSQEEAADEFMLILTGRDTGALAGLESHVVIGSAIQRLISKVESDTIRVPLVIKRSEVPPGLDENGNFDWEGNFSTHLKWTGPLGQGDADGFDFDSFTPAIARAVNTLIDKAAAQVFRAGIPRDGGSPEAGELPAQADVPDSLLLGTHIIRYYGWMLQEEAQLMKGLFSESTANQAAIQRLYEASQQAMIQGRDIRIMSRRGAAAPSAMTPFSFLTPKNQAQP